jgi:hypothetical protein
MDLRQPTSLVALSCCVALSAGCETRGLDDDSEREERDLVGKYCSYGAVSTAQLMACAENVRPREVLESETNAARYARGELDRCLPDSSLFCQPR